MVMKMGKCKIAIMKVYAHKAPVTMYGKCMENELLEDTCKRILKRNKLRNVGEFLVVSAFGNFAYITEYRDGIGLVNKHTIIAVYDIEKLAEMLNTVMKDEHQ